MTKTTLSPSPAGPDILVFTCRWCALSGAERAGRERLALDPRFLVIPLECAAALSTDIVLRAFADGARGIAVMGCHLGGCRHNEANRNAHARLRLLGAALDAIGVRPERLLLSWGRAHDGRGFAAELSGFIKALDALPESDELQLMRGQYAAVTAEEGNA